MDWVDWYNNPAALLVRNVPPAEYEAMYYSGQEQSDGSAESQRK
jgi:hypothetical protein